MKKSIIKLLILIVILCSIFFNCSKKAEEPSVKETEKIDVAKNNTPLPPPSPLEGEGRVGGYSEESKKEETQATATQETPVDGDWLVRSLSAEPQILNPITSTDVYSDLVDDLVYEYLADYDRHTKKLVPILAEYFNVSDDYLTYTYKLRKGIKWHDGKPLTIDDVMFSYNILMDPKTDSAHLKNYYQDVEKVEQIGDDTIKFTMKKPYFKAIEFTGGFPIMPKHIFDTGGDFNKHPNNRKPIGTGPYKFVKWDTGREIVLEKNPDYWGEKKPHFDKIIYKIITDPVAEIQALKNGEVDVVDGIAPEHWTTTLNAKSFNEKFNKYAYTYPQFSYIGWNIRKPFFEDKRVRTALTMLINRDDIIKYVLYDLAEPTSGPFMIGTPAYDTSIQPLPYDPVKARELLNEAGWIDHNNDGIRDKDNIKFEFTYLIPSSTKTGLQIAEIIKEAFTKEGIIVNIKRLEWATFLEQIMEWQFDTSSLSWALSFLPDYYQIFHSSQADIKKSSNHVGYKNPEADKVMEEIRTTFDEEKRNELYHKLQKIFHDDQAYTFLFVPKRLMAIDKRIHNVNFFSIRPCYLVDEWFVPKEQQKYK